MALPISASPSKVYIMLFVFICLCYVAFVIIKSLSKSPVDVEHFVEEKDEKYKFRMEVMKIFDLYLNRNPTPDEIDKYAGLGNEQDILLNVLKDFNINANDVDQEKLAKFKENESIENMAKEILEKGRENIWSGVIEVEEEVPYVMPSYDLNNEDKVELFGEDKVMIPIKLYKELKAKIAEIDELNKDMLDHHA